MVHGQIAMGKYAYSKHVIYHQSGICEADRTLQESGLLPGALKLELVQEYHTI